MGELFHFIGEHLWAPILGLFGWLIQRMVRENDIRHAKHEKVQAMNSRRIENIKDRLQRDYVKKSDLKELGEIVREEMKYIRDRVDQIADRLPGG